MDYYITFIESGGRGRRSQPHNWYCPLSIGLSSTIWRPGRNSFYRKYESQGVIPNTLNEFENFTFTVLDDISGQASIQVQHNYLVYQ